MAARTIYVTHQGRTLQLATLVNPKYNRLMNQRFEDCVLNGPAMVAVTKNCTFKRVNWGGGTLDDLFLVLPTGTRLVGVIAMEECEFIDCAFVGVGFVGDPYAKAKMEEHTGDRGVAGQDWQEEEG